MAKTEDGFCPLCGVTLDLHDGPDTCASAAWRDDHHPCENPRPVLVVDPAEARETIARAHAKVLDEWHLDNDLPEYALAGLLRALDAAVLAALAGQEQP